MVQTLQSPPVEAPLILGPSPEFRLVGGSVRLGPRQDEVACYRDGKWHSAGRTFKFLESETPTLVRFEGNGSVRAQVHGPFEAIRVENGVLRHGPAFDHILAVFDEEAGSWNSYPGTERYTTVVLRPGKLADSATEVSADEFIQKDRNQSRPGLGQWNG